MRKNNNSYIYFLILIVILGASLVWFYVENSKGIIRIDSINGDVSLFLDEKELGTINPDNQNEIKVGRGEHSIILSKEGYWPWIKEVEVNKQQITNIYPFFVPQNSNGFIIPKNDPEYQDIMNMFLNKTSVNWEMNEQTPDIIKTFKDEIKASDFYKDRDDVIIIAVKDGIYALEINSKSVPNFQPIYKGSDPIFVKKDNNSLYIKDSGALMEVLY